MAGRRIDRIEVKGFRGIKNLTPLILKGRSLVLFGENGWGKSAFVEAIEKVLTGQVSTLEGIQGLSFQRHGPHIRVGSNDWRVVLSLTGDPPVSAVAPADSLPTDPAAYFLPARQHAYILRRSQVLRFIDAQPRDRYETLLPFLPLAKLTPIESAAAEATHILAAERIERENAVSNAQELLRAACGIGDRRVQLDAASLLAAANEKLESIAVDRLAGLDDLPTAAVTLEGRIGALSNGRNALVAGDAVAALREAADSVSQVNSDPLTRASISLSQIEADLAGHFYESVLGDGAQWIEEDALTACPLCEQAMVVNLPEEVVRRARARLEHHSELLAARASVDHERSSLAAAVSGAQTLAGRADAALKRLGYHRDSLESLWEWAEALATGDRVRADLDRAVAALDADPDSGWAASLRSIADELAPSAGVDGDTNPASPLIQARDFVMKANQGWTALTLAERDLHRAKEIEARGIAYLGALQDSRKQMLADIFCEVSAEIDDIYGRLHEEPESGQTGVQGVRLELRDAFAGSINVRGDFYEKKDEDPRAFYSEAHLDTLGIAVFLALRHWHRRRNPGFDLLVIDDVLTSVDSAHAGRLAKVLIEESAEYQIVLTTHDQIFFERIRHLQRALGAESRFVNREITWWDVDTGPDIHEPQDQIEYLRASLLEMDGPAMTAMAGRILEGILREMRFRLGLSIVPKRDERYEIGDIWPAFLESAKKRFPGLYAAGAKNLDALDVNLPLRNWLGAHYNEWAKRISVTDARRFALDVCALYDLVFCKDCGDFVEQSRVPTKQLACRRGHLIYSDVSPAARIDRRAAAAANRGSLKDAGLAPVLMFDDVRRRDLGAK